MSPNEVELKLTSMKAVQIEPNDIVVVLCSSSLTTAARLRLRNYVAEAGIKNKILVLDKELDLAVVRPVPA